MQQRQPRLGDILDDYCPRERRVTNHAVVAMIEADVKQTRCTTCDTEHEYKHAKVPRQRRKSVSPAALYAQVAASAPKRVAPSASAPADEQGDDIEGEADAAMEKGDSREDNVSNAAPDGRQELAAEGGGLVEGEDDDGDDRDGEEEGPVHRPLIRASLPRTEGQPPPTRPIPEFTIRQPGGRPNRFRPRNQRGGQQFQGNRSDGNMGGGLPRGGGMPRSGGGRPPHGAVPSRLARRHGPGRKRSK
jgi:hypothetical protein